MNLETPIDQLWRTSTVTIGKLKKAGVNTFYDLISYWPFRYENYPKPEPISQLVRHGRLADLSPQNQLIAVDNAISEKVTIKGTVVNFQSSFTKRGFRLQKAVIADQTGKIDLIWFNQSYLSTIFKPGTLVQVSGILEYQNKLSIRVTDYDIIESPQKKPIHTGRLVPVYREKNGLTSKVLREKINNILYPLKNNIKELLPDEIINFNKLIAENEAYTQIHFPDSPNTAKQAQKKLAFDEMFTVLLSSKLIKKEWERKIVSHRFKFDTEKRNKVSQFIKELPFKLTTSQKKSVEQILNDLSKSRPMNRLLQGDVGSGKTVVAAIASYLVFLNGYKTIFMAPTEILAQQHFETLKKLFADRLRIILYTSTYKTTKDELAKANIIIGTHALIYKSVDFETVGLVVIDEQHKFGVRQRAELKKKTVNPHLLTMTATPIPRTILLTIFGELDVSVISELPKGRPIVKTFLVPPIKRDKAYQWIKKEIATKHIQVFIVCPLIEESEHESLQSIKAAKHEYDNLTKKFSDFQVGLLHGRLKSKDKTKIMSQFKEGSLDILVTTPVVEVGIDFPNATIIIIEAAERFGLSQLHQLRGRVGRGTKLSYCFLFTEKTSDGVRSRLQTFAKIASGFELAEYDLKNRGAGELFGTKQHGFMELKIASLNDKKLIAEAQNAVDYFMNHYSSLDALPLLKMRLDSFRITEIARD